jgi:hypothetical protein
VLTQVITCCWVTAYLTYTYMVICSCPCASLLAYIIIAVTYNALCYWVSHCSYLYTGLVESLTPQRYCIYGCYLIMTSFIHITSQSHPHNISLPVCVCRHVMLAAEHDLNTLLHTKHLHNHKTYTRKYAIWRIIYKLCQFNAIC